MLLHFSSNEVFSSVNWTFLDLLPCQVQESDQFNSQYRQNAVWKDGEECTHLKQAEIF